MLVEKDIFNDPIEDVSPEIKKDDKEKKGKDKGHNNNISGNSTLYKTPGKDNSKSTKFK